MRYPLTSRSRSAYVECFAAGWAAALVEQDVARYPMLRIPASAAEG